MTTRCYGVANLVTSPQTGGYNGGPWGHSKQWGHKQWGQVLNFKLRKGDRVSKTVAAGSELGAIGSRSKGRARPYSDPDLLFTRPARLSLSQRAELRSRFEASRPPYRVDLADADPLAPGTLVERVAAECRRL